MKLTLPDQLKLAFKQCRRKRDFAGMAYYSTRGEITACASWSQFKGSWAYTNWISQPHIQNIIASYQKIIQ